MDGNQTLNTPDDDSSITEMRVWGEFGAWCAFVMAPIIWWLQGPSVSTDQFVVRTSLIVISFAVGLGLRVLAIIQPCSPLPATHSGKCEEFEPQRHRDTEKKMRE